MADWNADLLEPLRAFAEGVVEGVVIIDSAGAVVEWNSQAQRLFGWSRQEAIGKQLSELVLSDEESVKLDAALDLDGDTAELASRGGPIRLTARTRGGSELPVLVSLAPVALEGQQYYTAYIHGVSSPSPLVHQLAGKATAAQLLHEIALVSATTNSFDDALGLCVGMICRLMGWPIGHVWLPDAKGQLLESTEIWTCQGSGTPESLQQARRPLQLKRGEGFPGKIWELGRPNWIADVQKDDAFLRGKLPDLEVHGAFGFPVFVDQRLVAVLEFLSPREVCPDEQFLALVDVLSSQLGNVFEHRRRDEECSRLAAVVESSHDAIISRRLDGTILSWNSGAEQVYGYTSAEAVGRSISLITPEGLTKEEAAISEVLTHGGPLHQFETMRRTRQGDLINVSITISPLPDSRGNILGAATIERDITDQKRREYELQIARQQAEIANRMKSEFLANISHELRTPMNAIIGMVELSLGHDDVPAAVQDYLETARDSAHILLAIMNDLLDFSRMEAGRIELEREPFHLRRVMSETMRILSLRAHEKGLELICHVAYDVPDHLEGDERRLKQIVLNLVGNAIKFTEHGEVRVNVDWEPAGGPAGRMQLHVTDTGIGIPPQDWERIFEPFTQVDASMTRRQGGTGLGLAICRDLVDKMGGQLTFTSRPKVGSTFTCTVPYRVLSQESAEERLDQLARLNGARVLVVDDNPSNRNIIDEMLKRWSLEPILAESGYEALEAIETAQRSGRHLRILLTDALMPDMDGFTLIETIHEMGQNDMANVLMLSPADRRRFEDRCSELPIAAYIEKPISEASLLDSLLACLQAPAPFRKRAVGTRPATSPLSVLVAEDTPANQKVIRAILEQRGHAVTIAPNGKALLSAFRRSQPDVIVMDVQMPVLDGLRATERIRRLDDARKAQVPIVAMTAHAMKRDRERCFAAGMDAYLAKPIDAAELIELVEELAQKDPSQTGLKRWKLADEQQTEHNPSHNVAREARAPGPDTTSQHGPTINLKAALDRLGGSRRLLKDLAEFFIDDTPGLLDQLHQGIESNDPERAGRAAHSLKGLAANFDAHGAVAVARQVESAALAGEFEVASARIDELTLRLAEVSARLQREVIDK